MNDSYTVSDVIKLIEIAREFTGTPEGRTVDLTQFYSSAVLGKMQQSLRERVIETDYRKALGKEIENDDDVISLLCSASGLTLGQGMPMELLELTYGKETAKKAEDVMRREKARSRRNSWLFYMNWKGH